MSEEEPISRYIFDVAIEHIDGLLGELRLLDQEHRDEYISAKCFLDDLIAKGLVAPK